jgi:hypothetical protein
LNREKRFSESAMPSRAFAIPCLPARIRSGAAALLLGLAGAGAAVPALAQLPAGVYKCRSDSASGFVFQGQPCPGDLGRVNAAAAAAPASIPAMRRELLMVTLAAERAPMPEPPQASASAPARARP